MILPEPITIDGKKGLVVYLDKQDHVVESAQSTHAYVAFDDGEFEIFTKEIGLRAAGGPESGNHGHAGRPGQVGGSGSGKGDGPSWAPADPSPLFPGLTNKEADEWADIEMSRAVGNFSDAKESRGQELAYKITDRNLVHPIWFAHPPMVDPASLTVIVKKSKDEPGEHHVTFSDGRQYSIYRDTSPGGIKQWEAVGLEHATAAGAAFSKEEIIEHLRKLDESRPYVDRYSGFKRGRTIREHLASIRAQTTYRTAGGPGSGNFGHSGRPGMEGGSGSGGSAASMFNPELIKEFGRTTYKNREKLIEMPIADFLGLADTGTSVDKAIRVKSILDSGEKFDSLPRLQFELKDGKAEIVGHEGRHRARELQQRGFKTMPVLIKGDIRWSEQNDPSAGYDYIKQWPEILHGQGGKAFSVPFPVTRREAAEHYKLRGAMRALKSHKSHLPVHKIADRNVGTLRRAFLKSLDRDGITNEKTALEAVDRSEERMKKEFARALLVVLNASGKAHAGKMRVAGGPGSGPRKGHAPSIESLNKLHDLIKDHPGRSTYPSASQEDDYIRKLEELHDGLLGYLKDKTFDPNSAHSISRNMKRVGEILYAGDRLGSDTALSCMHAALSYVHTSQNGTARTLGGPGSGNFGHSGRPGEVGGSGEDGGGAHAVSSKEKLDFEKPQLFLFDPKINRLVVGPQHTIADTHAEALVAAGLPSIGKAYDAYTVHGVIRDGGVKVTVIQALQISGDRAKASDDLHALWTKLQAHGATDKTPVDVGWGKKPLGKQMRELRAVAKTKLPVHTIADAAPSAGAQLLLHHIVGRLAGGPGRVNLAHWGGRGEVGGSGEGGGGSLDLKGPILGIVGRGGDVQTKNVVEKHQSHDELFGDKRFSSQRFRVIHTSGGDRIHWDDPPSREDYFKVEDHFAAMGVTIVTQTASDTGMVGSATRTLDPEELKDLEAKAKLPVHTIADAVPSAGATPLLHHIVGRLAGGPGSGWTAENGHVPGSQGGLNVDAVAALEFTFFPIAAGEFNRQGATVKFVPKGDKFNLVTRAGVVIREKMSHKDVSEFVRSRVVIGDYAEVTKAFDFPVDEDGNWIRALGDVVGHPFHGNQWTEGGGAFRGGPIRPRPRAEPAPEPDLSQGTLRDKSGNKYKVTWSNPTDEHGKVRNTYTVRNDAGRTIGFAEMATSGDKVIAVQVSPKFRHQGIATALYDYIENDLNIDIKPNEIQTPEGKGFSRARMKARVLGGTGSGNFGHSGRKGKVGGSGEGIVSANGTSLGMITRSGNLMVKNYEGDGALKKLHTMEFPERAVFQTDMASRFRRLGDTVYWMGMPSGDSYARVSDYFANHGLELAEQRTTKGVTIDPMLLKVAGGVGSGNFGHAGRPGAVGGSGAGGFAQVLDDPSKPWSMENPKLFQDPQNPGNVLLFHGTRKLGAVIENGLRPSVAGVISKDSTARVFSATTPQGAIAAVKYEDDLRNQVNGTPIPKGDIFVVIASVPRGDVDVHPRSGDLRVMRPILPVELLAIYPSRMRNQLNRDDPAFTRLPVWLAKDRQDVAKFFTDITPRALGGAGSGHFGHSGRPGAVGGSSDSASQSLGQAGVDDSLRNQFNGPEELQLANNMEFLRKAAAEHDFPVDKIIVKDYDKNMIVGGRIFVEAGNFDSRNGTITFRAKTLATRDDQAVEEMFVHEIAHRDWNDVSEELGLIAGGPPARDTINSKDSDLIKDTLSEKGSVLESEDGVTDYSRAYWRDVPQEPKERNIVPTLDPVHKWMDGDTGEMFQEKPPKMSKSVRDKLMEDYEEKYDKNFERAVDETLAEIRGIDALSKQRRVGVIPSRTGPKSPLGISPTWRAFHDSVKSVAKELRKRKTSG